MNHPELAGRCPPFALRALATGVLLVFAGAAQAAPVGGTVAAGAAAIATSGTRTTITQTTGRAVINWQGFGIAAGESVQFRQPGSSSVTLNRVVGSDPSAIFGRLSANGQVFLVNPNGVLFGRGAAVNVGGLVASTLALADTDFMAGNYAFSGNSRQAVVNRGSLQADGGYVALLGTAVTNEGSIATQRGSTALAAGEAITLDVLGDGLLQVRVDRGALNGLVANGGVIQADGGRVLLTAQAAGTLLGTVVNNTGVIRARTISSHEGTIKLLGDMDSGVMTVAGTLDASAPDGGHGGFIETSAARVRVQDGVRVSTLAPMGRTGEWLIDPQDFTIGSGATDNISGATLSQQLVTNSVVITTAPGPTVTTPGTPPVTNLHTAVEANGDIHVNEAVTWTATPSTTTLTLNATRDVNVNAAITATNGNFVACCGRDVNVNAAITTTNGSVLLSAGRNAILNAGSAMTVKDGNLAICAANDIRIGAAITLERGSSIPSQSLGLQSGLLLSAGTGGTGPGVAGGTLVFAPLAPPTTVIGPNAPVTIHYNPVNYTTPTNYDANFALSGGAAVTQRMLVFAAGGDRSFNGSRATTLSGLKGSPAGVTLVEGPGAIANFDTAAVGTQKAITFTGYTLGGPNAANFALPVSCCGPIVARTTGAITAAPIPPVPVPVVPVPVPVVPGPGPVVVVPVPIEPTALPDAPLPAFVPFVVAPTRGRLPQLVVIAPPAPPPLVLVVAREPEPVPPVAAPATTPVATPPVAAPAVVPYRSPARPFKPYRN